MDIGHPIRNIFSVIDKDEDLKLFPTIERVSNQANNNIAISRNRISVIRNLFLKIICLLNEFISIIRTSVETENTFVITHGTGCVTDHSRKIRKRIFANRFPEIPKDTILILQLLNR
ncbi:hypothetical protein Uis1B_0206 [Bifidobacterium margollesii]|uniref:Uncharacterized protein n=1 Tax=Bifidobacterium margollesii TaxID=2020964 RepID=A0A2N5JD11_9BIFI|nr:hypothetical protein Uis1B_0206 [Bifidobacterium margollesii]